MDYLKIIWARLKEVFDEWVADDAQTWAASVTFYTVFSLAPLLVLAVAIAGFVFGEEAARGELVNQLNGIMGSAGAEVLQSTVASAGAPDSNSGFIATLVSLALLFLGASKVFGELRSALNRIWSVQLDPDAGWKIAVRTKVSGFATVLVAGVLLSVAVVASTFLNMFLGLLGSVAQASWFAQSINYIVSFVVTTLLFGALFKYIPDVKIEWRDVAFGAFITALLFTIGKVALSLYITYGNLGSGYGAASSLVVLLAWIYYSVQIFFAGAEFTQVHARHRGRRIRPNKHAVEITKRRSQPSTT